MSQWSHLIGCLTFDASPYDMKGGRAVCPFPEEQFCLTAARPDLRRRDGYKGHGHKPWPQLEIGLRVSSLARAKPIAERLLKKAFAGWNDAVDSSVSEGQESRSHASRFAPLEKKAWKRLVKEYLADGSKSLPPDRFVDMAASKAWVESGAQLIVSLSGDMSDIGGTEIMARVERLLRSFMDEGLSLRKGHLEWSDEWARHEYGADVFINWVRLYSFEPGTRTVKESKTLTWGYADLPDGRIGLKENPAVESAGWRAEFGAGGEGGEPAEEEGE